MTPLLEVRDLSVAYGNVSAVRGASFKVEPGSIVTIIGANGAGKTSLLNATAGALPAGGRVTYQGEDVSWLQTEDRVELGMSLVPEQRELFGSMTVADNLLLGGYVLRRDRAAFDERLLEVYRRFPRLEERKRQLATTLSGGERQMLAVGRALMSRPRLLLLDEPSLGLAPLLVREIFRIIQSLRQIGVSVLLVEQNARAALETADYAYVMETGEVSFHGPAAELMHDARVAKTYLGAI